MQRGHKQMQKKPEWNEERKKNHSKLRRSGQIELWLWALNCLFAAEWRKQFICHFQYELTNIQMRFESSRRLTDCIRDIRMSRYTFYTHTHRHTPRHTPRHRDIHRKKSSAVQKEAIVSTDRLVKLFHIIRWVWVHCDRISQECAKRNNRLNSEWNRTQLLYFAHIVKANILKRLNKNCGCADQYRHFSNFLYDWLSILVIYNIFFLL